MQPPHLNSDDALVVVDVQNDFLPGGSLPVPCGDEVVPVLNEAIDLFSRNSLPVFATRDWHPPGHCSFKSQGGPWPVHCIAGSRGAAFPDRLRLPQGAIIISKGIDTVTDAYSGFEGTDLAAQLRASGSRRLFVGGLATDYCVLNTVKDALSNGFRVVVLLDAIRAVDVSAGDGESAIREMTARGAEPAQLSG